MCMFGRGGGVGSESAKNRAWKIVCVCVCVVFHVFVGGVNRLHT